MLPENVDSHDHGYLHPSLGGGGKQEVDVHPEPAVREKVAVAMTLRAVFRHLCVVGQFKGNLSDFFSAIPRVRHR